MGQRNRGIGAISGAARREEAPAAIIVSTKKILIPFFFFFFLLLCRAGETDENVLQQFPIDLIKRALTEQTLMKGNHYPGLYEVQSAPILPYLLPVVCLICSPRDVFGKRHTHFTGGEGGTVIN